MGFNPTKEEVDDMWDDERIDIIGQNGNDALIYDSMQANFKDVDVPSKSHQVGGNHYCKFDIQPWDIIDEYELSFYEGNVLKYLLRTKDNRLEDLLKAVHYLDKCVTNERLKI